MDTWRWNWHITIVSVLGIVSHSNGTSCDLSLFHFPFAVIESPQRTSYLVPKVLLKLICVYRCIVLCLSLSSSLSLCLSCVFCSCWYFALFCLVCYRIQTSSPLKISFHGWHLFFPFVSFSIKGHQLLLHKETKTFDQIQGKILIYSLFSLICKNQIWSLVFAAWVECRRCGEHLTGEIVRSAKISNFSLTGNLNITFHLHFLSQRIRLPTCATMVKC